jgi:hypothetical protein
VALHSDGVASGNNHLGWTAGNQGH